MENDNLLAQCGIKSKLQSHVEKFVKLGQIKFTLIKMCSHLHFRWNQFAADFFCLLISRKFVKQQWPTAVWKLWKFNLALFGENFVKATFLLNKLLKSWFDEIFFSMRPIFHFYWGVVISEIWFHAFLAKISWMQHFY